MLVTSLLLVGCATEGKFSTYTKSPLAACARGATFVNVHYGDSEISAHAIAQVKVDGVFLFRLAPRKRQSDQVNYDDMLVTITGKSSDPNASWINVSGKYEDSKVLAICVPSDIDEGTYEYFIEVEKVGKLDPRADVTK
jgi:hypothetical protein